MRPHACTPTSCWGWGAVRVEGVPKGWKCPGCGAKDAHANVMPDGLKVCGDCARAIHLEVA